MNRNLLKYVLLALSAALLLGVLLERAQNVNEALHNQYRSDLRQIDSLHDVLNENVLRSKLGLLTYYDPLNDTLKIMENVRADLAHVPWFIGAQGQEDIALLLVDYDKLSGQQRDLVEHFKTDNAVLINSLSYFTIVVSDVAGGANGTGIDPEIKTTLNTLLQDVLLYNTTTDQALIPRIQQNLDLLKQKKDKLDTVTTSLIGGLDVLVTHANIVIQRKPVIDSEVEAMFALPISKEITGLSNIYDANYDVARQNSNFYQIALYLFSLLVVGYISVSIIVRLRRSAGVISKAKEELQITYANLEKRSGELEVANSELEVATKEAREASRLKDEFLAVMSHELRTPLNAIIGFQGILLMMGQLNEKATHMIERAQVNAERLLALINDILDISRIESGRLQLTPVDWTVADAVDTWRNQMSVLAEQKGLKFSVNVAETIPPVIRADEDAITKIVTNLLGNAFKFTEKGEVALDLSRNNGNWVIKVSDTGIGIPAHMQQIIFERFRQVDGSSKRKYGGSGLGLAIVSNLCTAMNGTVSVESIPDQGSTFTVTLPLEAVEVERGSDAAH